MSFQQKILDLKQRIEGNLPPRFLRVIQGANVQLKKSGIEDKVLKVGARVPEFELRDQKGQLIKSQELHEQGPLVISFYRGFWCPYCNADLAGLNEFVPEIKSLGASVFGISPEKAEYSKKVVAIQKLDFDLLHDDRNEVAENFGVKFALPDDVIELYRDKLNINLKLYNGSDDWTLPIPARFLVDKEGIIRYAESSADYSHRPDPEALMEVLRGL